MTQLVINPPNQQLSFQLATTYSDGTTPLPKTGVSIRIAVGSAAGGPYSKSIQDTALTPDANGFCHYAMANLGVNLTQPNYAVLYTDVPGPGGTVESVASAEVGFQNLAPNPPQAVSAD